MADKDRWTNGYLEQSLILLKIETAWKSGF